MPDKYNILIRAFLETASAASFIGLLQFGDIRNGWLIVFATP